ncbi:NAD(P)-dependent oxidoreductase [Rhizobium leguminosarum]|uniref:NAD(P)-dependent oxidoreductase n=1 Tax=Rhizobium leguminosarum TaxID=384 RepID=UPI001C9479CB|nr:NAD(P)-dependent oxidoreductase [Rhizobium leguminosarum]MBY5400988.1 NAD(P)-dependent oxidoreductase [Rhizobium leguminosarum]
MNDETPRLKIAFIGLGAMGLPMAGHLIGAGREVAGFDLSDEARRRFSEAGGISCADIAAAVWNADVIITMLPNGKIVREALLGGENWRSLKQGALVIDMSSSAPGDTRRLSEQLRSKGIRLVDAPVSGGTRRAVSGTLSIMVGGEATDVDEAEPLLRMLGANIFRTGAVGSGHAMKAINNYVSGAGVVATIEGVLLGKEFGLEPTVVVDILNASSGKSNTSEIKMKQFILSETFNSGFALGLMAKDIGIANGLASELGLNFENLVHTAGVWERAAKDLGGGVDHTEIVKYLDGHRQGGTE